MSRHRAHRWWHRMTPTWHGSDSSCLRYPTWSCNRCPFVAGLDGVRGRPYPVGIR